MANFLLQMLVILFEQKTHGVYHWLWAALPDPCSGCRKIDEMHVGRIVQPRRRLPTAMKRTIGKSATVLAATFVLAGWQTNARGDVYQLDGRTYQVIEVFGTTGSQCSYRREGRLLATFALPRRNNFGDSIEGAEIDLTTSHEDITVTCRLRGRSPKSKVISYGASDAILVLAPCAPPPAASEGDLGACMAKSASTSGRVKEYPELVRMRFDTAD